MSKVVPLKIDTDLGKLPLKEKGLDMIDFKSTEELRRNQLEKLVAGFRLFSYFGYDEGVAGHITFRDPEFNDHFWVNPLGVHFGQISLNTSILHIKKTTKNRSKVAKRRPKVSQPPPKQSPKPSQICFLADLLTLDFTILNLMDFFVIFCKFLLFF